MMMIMLDDAGAFWQCIMTMMHYWKVMMKYEDEDPLMKMMWNHE